MTATLMTSSAICHEYGSQVPTFRVMPEADSSDGDRAVRLLKRGKLHLLAWQAQIITDWLSHDDDGTWAAGTCGLSVPRQNGKSVVVVGRGAFGMIAYGEWVIYTAHLQKTATETFEAFRTFFETPAMAKYVSEIKTALGREEIRLTNGGRVKFLARTRNGGRGQHGDLLIFDEAQGVDDDMQASFLPCLAASKNPQTIYAGTPPDETMAGTVFKRLRQEAHAGHSKGVCWAEWSVDRFTPERNSDRALWGITNPSYGFLIKPGTVENEFAQLAPDRFARERLGWWENATAKKVDHPIQAAAWDRCQVEKPRITPQGVTCYGVKFSPDGTTVSLSVAVKQDTGRTFVEGIECASIATGTAWLVDWLYQRKDKAAQMVIDGRAGAQALIDRLIERGVPRQAVIAPSTANIIAAMQTFYNGVQEQTVAHAGQPALTAAVTLTDRRKIGNDGGWGFKSTDQGDASIAESAALAFWASQTTKRKPGRRAIVW